MAGHREHNVRLSVAEGDAWIGLGDRRWQRASAAADSVFKK
jgi:hypothetical protein